MAVNVTQLAAALRLGDGVTAPAEPLLGILTRLLGVGDATVSLLAPDAPDVVKDEAVINYAAQLYDKPSAASGNRYAAAWRNSGAASLVAAWVVRRVVEDADSGSDTPTTVERYDLRFDASSYALSGGVNCLLTVPYPTGLTRARASAAFKTGFVNSDAQETPPVPNTSVIETAGSSMHGEGSTIRVDFLDTNIRLSMFGVTLDDVNQRDGWQLRLSMVS